ncbi:MAG TPA: zincin-like metallopeptidase domain-containing protein [Thermoanaerobaculia bacterium]
MTSESASCGAGARRRRRRPQGSLAAPGSRRRWPAAGAWRLHGGVGPRPPATVEARPTGASRGRSLPGRRESGRGEDRGRPRRRPPKLRHGGERAFYRRSSDLVQLPKPEAFSRPEHYYSTQFHELAHATGHPSRLNRFAEEDNPGVFGRGSAPRELRGLPPALDGRSQGRQPLRPRGQHASLSTFFTSNLLRSL